jgi:nucleoside-diphosphate-sugar epimerase
MSRRTVLVTGMSGLIGGAVRPGLEGLYDLRALNRRPLPGVACHQADIADLAAIAPAFAGVDVVVHLAAIADSKAPDAAIVTANVTGTYNVLEAARRAGVARVVLASSGATVAGYERQEPWKALVTGRYEDLPRVDGRPAWPMITHESPVRPIALYGVSKVWGEALGRMYADVHGLSVICLRIGHVSAEDRPSTPREFSVWCSQRDVARMIDLAVAAPDSVRYGVCFVTSRNHWSYRDLEHSRALLGFAPLDVAEHHRR